MPCLERQGLVRAWSWAQNVVVTITYPNGTVLEAIVLSHEETEIRVMAAGPDDVLAFTRIHGTWISEEVEPVVIEFAWQRPGTSPSTSKDNCVCSKALAEPGWSSRCSVAVSRKKRLRTRLMFSARKGGVSPST